MSGENHRDIERRSTLPIAPLAVLDVLLVVGLLAHSLIVLRNEIVLLGDDPGAELSGARALLDLADRVFYATNALYALGGAVLVGCTLASGRRFDKRSFKVRFVLVVVAMSVATIPFSVLSDGSSWEYHRVLWGALACALPVNALLWAACRYVGKKERSCSGRSIAGGSTRADEPDVGDGVGAADGGRDRVDEVARRYGLTPREAEVLALLARGYTQPAVRDRLGIALGTVDSHVKRIYAKLGVHSRDELIELCGQDEPRGESSG